MITSTINPNPDPTLNRVFSPGPISKKPNPPLNPRSSSLHFSPNPSSCKSPISAMALHLCRPKHRFPNNLSLIHLFSTSPDDDDDKNATQTTATTATTNKASLNSYFSDVKASLKKPTTTTSPYSSSLEEIRKNLAEYRQRSAPPPPPTGESNPAATSQSRPISFQELYRRNQNLNQNSEVKPGGGKLSFEAIRQSLRQMRANSNTNMNDNRSKMNAGNNADSMSMFAFGNSLKSKGQDGIGGSVSRVIGGTQELPASVFGREMKEGKKGEEREREGMKTEFVKIYNYAELGEKLRQLRPEGGKSGTGFSLQELNERLMRLRELEKKDRDSRIHGVPFRELRETLERLSQSGEEKQKKSSVRLDILGHIGGTPSFMLHPAKEHLVEKYFHPDNMSSAEKMKIELAKVREEFKMSESDCGSARVQVAQLTTKIKHLSSVLHKRDKHSLKGLLAMVQKRKRLLKYLRRTDWDSYCFVLSKLGLRDNPDYKALN